jgi:hypothetical protein
VRGPARQAYRAFVRDKLAQGHRPGRFGGHPSISWLTTSG